MKRVSVDIGGTFTDCFLVWGERKVGGKALTTHHNLAVGFHKALANALAAAGAEGEQSLAELDSIRYATTLGTNALIERDGPRVGLLVTAGFEATVPLSRGRGYGDGMPDAVQRDDGSWLVDGLLSIDELKELFELDKLPDEEHGHYQTVGGLVMTQIRSIPTAGQWFYCAGLRFEVMEMDGRRVDKVLVTTLRSEPPPQPENS